MVTWNLHGIPRSHGKDERVEHVARVLLDREPDLVLRPAGTALSRRKMRSSSYATLSLIAQATI